MDEFVGVENDEAELSKGACFHIDIGRLQIGDEIAIGGHQLGEGEFLAAVLLAIADRCATID